MNFLFRDLAVQYPTINKSLFKAIFENILSFINILKLSTDYSPDPEKIKVHKISNILAIDSVEDYVLLSNMKGSSYVLQYLLLYITILLYFTSPTILYNLKIGLYAYMYCLLDFTILYI